MKSKTTNAARRPDGTLNALQTALGISKRRVSDLLNLGMPDSPAEALAWRNARENDDSTTELRRRRIALLAEQQRIAKASADLAEGKAILRTEVAELLNRIGAAVNAAMRVAETEIPQVCAGLELSQSKPKAKECLRRIQAALADNESEFWKTHPEITTTNKSKL